MTDAVTEIKPTLDLVGIDWNTTRDLIDDIINSDPEDVYLDSEEALTRFMFRNEITGRTADYQTPRTKMLLVF